MTMQAQFARACRMLGVPLGTATLVVACSGGADSGAALLLARRVAPKAKLVACYVDHGMRPKASIAADREAVRAQARRVQAGVIVKQVRLAARSRGSPEERARNARYGALAGVATKHKSGFVVTGHQQDDLVETTMLALFRGSGIDGIAAMRPRRKLAQGVELVRPLLWASKAQCLALMQEQGVRFSVDETNADLRMPRNLVRSLLARLEERLPGVVRGVTRSAVLLADDKSLLEQLAAETWRRAHSGVPSDLSVRVLRGLPLALLRRVIRHALAASGSDLRNFSFDQCNAIAQAIKEKRGGRFQAGRLTIVLSSGKLSVERNTSDGVVVEHMRPVSIDVDRLKACVRTPLGACRFKVCNRARVRPQWQQLDFAALRAAGRLELRKPKPGDVCAPFGRTRPMSLARFLAKAGVPVQRRKSVLLLCAGGRIAAVLGQRIMEPFRPKAQGAVLALQWQAADNQAKRA